MTDETKCDRAGGEAALVVGPLWFIGWLFTVAFAQLAWWKAVVGLVIWPYYLGAALR